MCEITNEVLLYCISLNISPGFYFLPRPWRPSVKTRLVFNRDLVFINHLSILTARISRKCLAKLAASSFFLQLLSHLLVLHQNERTTTWVQLATPLTSVDKTKQISLNMYVYTQASYPGHIDWSWNEATQPASYPGHIDWPWNETIYLWTHIPSLGLHSHSAGWPSCLGGCGY